MNLTTNKETIFDIIRKSLPIGGNPNNIYVWAEQSQFETYNLSKQKTCVKNVWRVFKLNKQQLIRDI